MSNYQLPSLSLLLTPLHKEVVWPKHPYATKVAGEAAKVAVLA